MILGPFRQLPSESAAREEIASLQLRPLAHGVRPSEAAAEQKLRSYSTDVDIGIAYLELVDQLNTLCFPVIRSAH